MLVLYIFAVVFLVFLIITLTRINMVIEYVGKGGGSNNIILSLYYLNGLLKFKYEVSLADFYNFGLKLIKKGKKGVKEKKNKKRGRLAPRELRNELRGIIGKIKKYGIAWGFRKHRLLVEELKLDVYIGTGEAYHTGIYSGIAWAVAGILVSLLENNFRVNKKHVDIHPHFEEKKFEIDFFCIFSLKIAHIIVMALKYGKQVLLNKLAKRQA